MDMVLDIIGAQKFIYASLHRLTRLDWTRERGERTFYLLAVGIFILDGKNKKKVIHSFPKIS